MKRFYAVILGLILMTSFCFAGNIGVTITYHTNCKRSKDALKIKHSKKTYYFEKMPIHSTDDVNIEMEFGLSKDGMGSIEEGDYYLIPSLKAKNAIKNKLTSKKRITLLIAGDGHTLGVVKVKSVPDRIKIDKAVIKELAK